MTEHDKRIIDRIEVYTFQVNSEMSELLGKLRDYKFEESLAISINLRFLTSEIVRLNRKLTVFNDE